MGFYYTFLNSTYSIMILNAKYTQRICHLIIRQARLFIKDCRSNWVLLDNFTNKSSAHISISSNNHLPAILIHHRTTHFPKKLASSFRAHVSKKFRVRAQRPTYPRPRLSDTSNYTFTVRLISVTTPCIKKNIPQNPGIDYNVTHTRHTRINKQSPTNQQPSAPRQ